MRASGVLLAISSLPSPYGIGSFSKEAYTFVDQLKQAGQSYWQILPLGPTSYGDSPYQSLSTFAGNPYYIDLDTLAAEGLLEHKDIDLFLYGDSPMFVDYDIIYKVRFKILRVAFQNFKPDEAYETFQEENNWWLDDYALFMAIKNATNGDSWMTWDEPLRLRDTYALFEIKEKLAKEIEFIRFQQFEFHKQWTKLKSYANENGIKIIGDIPIYVSLDSADTWANTHMFQMDANGVPKAVSGCPPDAFSATGQLWGNPLYKWDYHRDTNYRWWISRLQHNFKLFDIVRIDHFRGFDEYYSIPYGNPTAEFGHWEPGPAYEMFRIIKEKLGDIPVIAEDLGFLTEGVYKLLSDTGFPGMKVLQFAFDSREDSDYLPHNYNHNCVVYTGTHDNTTTRDWIKTITKSDRRFALRYLNLRDRENDQNEKSKLPGETFAEDKFPWDMIRLAMESVADTAIIPIQDYLCLDKEARMNTPSTLGNNWRWRLLPGQIDENLIKMIYEMTKLYGRI